MPEGEEAKRCHQERYDALVSEGVIQPEVGVFGPPEDPDRHRPADFPRRKELPDLDPEAQRSLDRYLEYRQRLVEKRLTSKPSPRAFGIGDDVVVVHPESKYFKRIGTVTDIDYLESSARKGYSDYSVTVDFPDGQTRKFLTGRVRPVDFLTGATEVYLDEKAERYAKVSKERKLRRLRK